MNDKKEKDRRVPDLVHSLLFVLVLLFFMTYAVCTDVLLFRYAVVLVYVLTAFLLIRVKSVALITAFPCFFALVTASSTGVFPLFLALFAAIGCGAFAWQRVNPLFLLLAPAGAYAIAVTLTRDAVFSLLVLIPVPCALVLSFAIRKGFSRTAAAAAVTAALLAIAVFAVLVFVRQQQGTVTMKFFTELLIDFRNSLVDHYIEMLNAVGLADVVTVDRELLQSAVNLLIRLIPAVLVVVAEAIAYFAGLIAVSMHSAYFPESPLPRNVMVFRMSGVSAVLFLLSFLVFLLFPSDSDVLGIVSVTATNLNLILLPGLALCGILNFLAGLRQKKRISLFPTLMFLIVLIFYTAVIPYVLAFSGSFAVLRAGRKRGNDETGSL